MTLRGPRLGVALGAMLAWMLVAGPVSAYAAGTVTIVDAPSPTQQRLQFTAGAGDTNNVTFASSAPNVYTITDTGAVINTAAAGCSGSGTNTVTCTDADIVALAASLGDMNDRVEDNTGVAKNAGNSWIGGPGNDTLIGSDAALRTEFLTGQAGDDTINGRRGVDTLQGEEGNDTLNGGGEPDNLNGGEGADIVNGGDGNDRLGEDRDEVQDVLSGDDGDDLYTPIRFPFPPPAGDDILNGGAGVDQVVYEDFNFLFFGQPNEPAIFTLWDGAQNDTIGESTFNLIDIEDVDTSSTGGGENSGDDEIEGNAAANVIRTFDGNDTVDGLGGPDIIDVAGQDDTVEARDGFRDRVDCGEGTDTASVDQLDVVDGCENLTVSFRQPAGTSPARRGYVLVIVPPPTLADCGSGKNTITLSATGDVRSGTALGDLIFAAGGDDTINGLGGDDCLDLGAGDDRGDGGPGRDLVLGGAGADRADGGAGNDRLNGNAGGDRVSGGSGDDRAVGGSGVDRLAGGSGNDRLGGDSGRDRISGSGGRDRIAGGAGGDRISGGGSRDKVSAGAGNDRISARDGRRDRINCGPGNDRVRADRNDIVAGNCETVRRRG